MSSSGTSSFFGFVMLLAIGAGGSVYLIKHRTDVALIANIAAGKAQATRDAVARTEMEDKSKGDFGDIELKAAPSGHFETEARVNGSEIDVMVDTGATLVALTYEDAERAGIFLKPADFTHYVSTANGKAKIAPIAIGSIAIGDITVRNVQGAVSERGKLSKTLLGMSFLSRLSRVEMRSNSLVLHE